MEAVQENTPTPSPSIKDCAVYTLSPEGRVSSWNSGAAAISGYLAEEVLGHHFSIFFTAADRACGKPEELLNTAARMGWAEGDACRIRKDGARFDAHITLTALRDYNGNLMGFAKIVRDLTSRRNAEAVQAQQTQFLRMAHEAVLVRDLQGRITFWNEGAQSLYQWTAEEAIGRVVHELLSTSFPVPLVEIEEVTRHNEMWEGRLTHSRKDGTRVIVDSRWSLQCDEFGAPISFLELNRDITRHVAAEDELRESNERFYQAFEEALIGKGLMTTVDNRWLRVNRAFCEMLGYTSEELVGKHFLDITHPEDYDIGRNERRDLLTGKINSYRIEKRYLRKDGEILRVLLSISMVRKPYNSAPYYIIEIEDITESRKAVESLAEQRNLFEAVLDNMTNGLALMDLTGKVVLRNRVGRSLFGRARNVLPQDFPRVYGMYRPDQKTLFDFRELPAWRVMQGEDSAELEVWLQNEATEGAWVYIQSKPFLNLAGSTRGILTVIHDVTRQKQMEAELDRNRRHAAATARLSALGMMASGIAHEINNPLGIIHASASNLLEMVEARQLPLQELQKNSVRIAQTADRIAKIVGSMRLISRHHSADPMLETPVLKIIEECLDLCGESFKMHSVALTCCAVDPGLKVKCREGQIAQILLNLLQNALDAVETVKSDRKVSIEVMQGEGVIIITVLDNGPGFSAEAKQFAMDPFFTTKPVGKGTGLGLSISSTIAESHGGKIEIAERNDLTCVSLFLNT